jgi:hypothetical protein
LVPANAGLGISLFLYLLILPAEAQDSPQAREGEAEFFKMGAIAQNPSEPVTDTSAGKEIRGPSERPVLTVKEKWNYLFRSTYEPKSIFFSLAGAGIKQAMDSIPEWGQGMEGYGKRLGSSLSHKIIKRNIYFGAGTLLREDPRYFYSEEQGIWKRSLYAMSRTFVSNKDGGGIRPGYTKFLATFGGAYISRQWQPERKQTVNEYLISSSISIGIDMAKNVFNEFWPDIRNALHRRP